MRNSKKIFKSTCLLMLLIALLVSPIGDSAVLHARAYDEPVWNMSYLYSSTHYTDSSGKTWYPRTAFYLPQFDTGVINADGLSTSYKTSEDGGQSWDNWNNHNHYAGYLTPDEAPMPTYDFYYQFAGKVSNSDPEYNGVPYYSAKFYIDDKSPNISFSPICNTGSSQPITVTFGANDTGSDAFDGDTGSGLDHYIYRFSYDNGSTWGTWSGSFVANQSVTFSNSGAYQIEVRAWDHVGNESDEISGSYIINNNSAGASVPTGSYRTNTDVITSVTVTNTGGDITPDTGASVSFSIPGITAQSKGFVLPAGASELIWFRWHTPSTPQTLSANISVSAGSTANMSPSFDIYNLTENTPPDPKGTDRADPYFEYTTPPNLAGSTSASWTSYTAQHVQKQGQSYQQQFDADGNPLLDSDGNYVYAWVPYYYWVWQFSSVTNYATLSASLLVSPDSNDHTATSTYGTWTMKSGYGITENVATSLSASDSSAVTGVQNVVGYYPEFMYADSGYTFGNKYRVFDELAGGFAAAFDLKANPFSMYGSHVHFLPVWWQNGEPYDPTVVAFDCWTPAGQLVAQSSSTINIQGSVFDDYHVKPSY